MQVEEEYKVVKYNYMIRGFIVREAILQVIVL
jgi:hypothetical protein